MPLAGPESCMYPDCTNKGVEHHHIVYDSRDARHSYCHHNVKKGNTTEPHDAEIVPLCRRHHQSITNYNERMWRLARYTALSCAQRRKFFKLWLKNEYPEGVDPKVIPPPINVGKVYKQPTRQEPNEGV